MEHLRKLLYWLQQLQSKIYFHNDEMPYDDLRYIIEFLDECIKYIDKQLKESIIRQQEFEEQIRQGIALMHVLRGGKIV